GRGRGGARGPRRRRGPRPVGEGGERGQLRAARRRGGGRAAVPAGHRGRRPLPGPPTSPPPPPWADPPPLATERGQLVPQGTIPARTSAHFHVASAVGGRVSCREGSA